MDKINICDCEYSESKSCVNCENVKLFCSPIEEQHTTQFQPFTKKQKIILEPINTKISTTMNSSLFSPPLSYKISKNIIFSPPALTCQINTIPSPRTPFAAGARARCKYSHAI